MSTFVRPIDVRPVKRLTLPAPVPLVPCRLARGALGSCRPGYCFTPLRGRSQLGIDHSWTRQRFLTNTTRATEATDRGRPGSATSANVTHVTKETDPRRPGSATSAILRAARIGAVWIVMSLRLVLFSLMLLPPFITTGFHYFRDPRIIRRVRFGPGPRSFADIYRPAEAMTTANNRSPTGVPVVVAVMGGAWVIGHRAWNVQLARRLMDAGVLVVALDYRNYPRGSVRQMVEDLDRGLSWAFNNVENYGGDRQNVVLTGQSAGAHLLSLCLLQRTVLQVMQENEQTDVEMGATGGFVAGLAGVGQNESMFTHNESSLRSARWSVRDVRGFVGVSGPYNLPTLRAHLEDRGLGGGFIDLLCRKKKLEDLSPVAFFNNLDQKIVPKVVNALPPMLLFHGGADKSVPSSSSVEFAEALKAAGMVDVSSKVVPGLSHAEVIIEGPMRGEDHQIQLLLPYLFGKESEDRFKALPPLKPMFPRCIINMASVVMPF